MSEKITQVEQWKIDELIVMLPEWICYDKKARTFKVNIEPVKCQKCGHEWYPRIKSDGTITIPTSCAIPGCRNRLWWRKRKH